MPRPPVRHGRRSALVVVALVLGLSLLWNVLIAVGLNVFVVKAYFIPGPSMAPTLNVGDRVLVNRRSYARHGPHRGDIVVFTRPTTGRGSGRALIKRVVAVGGDVIESRGGALVLNGQAMAEPYVSPTGPGAPVARQTIRAGTVFLLGDNRSNSSDSRVYGAIEVGDVVGRAFLKLTSRPERL